MEFCKLQVGCLIVLLYVAFIYIKECRVYGKDLNDTLFDELLSLGIFTVLFDGATAISLNYQDLVSPAFNTFFHLMFLICFDSVIFMLFIYAIQITGATPKKRSTRVFLFSPFIVNIILVVANINSLEYINGETSYYSSGAALYTSYVIAWVYIVLSFAIYVNRWKNIEQHKRSSIITYLLVLAAITIIQLIFPEVQFASVGVTIFVLGIYMNQEDPSLQELSKYHGEMVMGFANLIENRDDNTGGHIKRSVAYVEIITNKLIENNFYSNVLTKDYVSNLLKAAPMHDIGKIAVPDAILQKPARLTEDEFEGMKTHSEVGSEIIKRNFSNLGDTDYVKMAYEVTRYHHEKWNGKGYPDGLMMNEIPLCARIMAVADVFDAISSDRCYRKALPFDECFKIISKGSAIDFDPLIAQVFISAREEVERTCMDMTIELETEIVADKEVMV